jgi:predicted GNAT family acetyltransferase
MATQSERNLATQDSDNGIRRAKVRADIVRRLQPVCSHLSEREFAMLVNLMTERQLKSERGDILV